MNIEEKKMVDEVRNFKKNKNGIYEAQLLERNAFLNAPENAEGLKKVKLGMKIAKAVYKARISAKMTQQQLAERLHTRQSYIAEAENGRRNMTISTLERYADACGKHVELKFV